MKAFFARAARWFTDARRAALQALFASAASLLVVIGAVSDAQSTALLDLAASALLAVQGAIGLALLRPSDWYVWLNTNGRGLVYTLAGSVGVAGVAFSLWSGETSSLIVQVSTVLASILVAAVQMVNVHTLTPDPNPTEILVPLVADTSQFDEGMSKFENPATYLTERIPEPVWPAPLSGLKVLVFGRGLSDAEVRHVLAPAEVGEIVRCSRLDETRGRSADVVLSTVGLTPELRQWFVPTVASSIFDGDPIRAVAL